MGILQKGNKLGVAVHHSVYKPANNLAELKSQAVLFNSWHKSKSWAEDTKTPSAYPYISYHYLMATNGEMLNVTDEKYVKYHAGDNFRNDLSFNLHGIAVCLTGNYENDKPTDAQMKALVLFIRDVEKRYDINARVRGHKETSATATACPGKNIGTSASGWLKSVIANVNNPNYPPPPPPPPADPIKELKERIVILEKEISGLRTALSDLEDKNTVLTGLIKAKDTKIKELGGKIVGLEEEAKELMEKYGTLMIEKNRIENESLGWQEKLGECKKQLEEGKENFIKVIVEWVKEVLAEVRRNRS